MTPRLKRCPHCGQPYRKLQRIDSCTERCARCGWLYAMVPMKSGGAMRKWVAPGSPLPAAGSVVTAALLAIGRAGLGRHT